MNNALICLALQKTQEYEVQSVQNLKEARKLNRIIVWFTPPSIKTAKIINDIFLCVVNQHLPPEYTL